VKFDFAIAGWLMFFLSGVLFLISAIRAADWFVVGGSVVWLIGVALFLMGRSRHI
jgi:hypothetical protein